MLGDHRDLVRLGATVVGATFLLVGILGFVPGITTNYGQIEFASHMSGSKLLGIFQASILHYIVHLLFGVAGLVLARKSSTARTYLIGDGIISLVLWIHGLIVDKNSNANFLPFNHADDCIAQYAANGLAPASTAALCRRPAATHPRAGRPRVGEPRP